MIDLDELEALAKAADQLEWSVAPRVSTYKVCDSDPARQALLESHGMDRFEAVSVGTRRGQIANVPLDESSRENAMWIAAAQPKAILELCAEVRRLRERREGPGTPSARMEYLHSELDKRFPDAVDPVLSDPPEPKYLAAIDALAEAAADWKRRWQDAVNHASEAIAERNHWQANHDHQVARARFLIERGDIPVERVRAYQEMESLRADAECWRAGVRMHKFPEYGTGDLGTWVWYIADVDDEFDTPEAAIDAARDAR